MRLGSSGRLPRGLGKAGGREIDLEGGGVAFARALAGAKDRRCARAGGGAEARAARAIGARGPGAASCHATQAKDAVVEQASHGRAHQRTRFIVSVKGLLAVL